VWDIRKHSTFERKITGHQGPVFCLDWHPEDKNLIATGGRDRFIQVLDFYMFIQYVQIWDLNSPGKPLYSVQTVSSVSHINWRPGSKYQIASTGLMDSKIHVWLV
jgi:WD40 repeat protein